MANPQILIFTPQYFHPYFFWIGFSATCITFSQSIAIALLCTFHLNDLDANLTISPATPRYPKQKSKCVWVSRHGI